MLFACCGSSRWVQEMMDRRPFESLGKLQQDAAEAFEGLSRSDWLEAFAAHPRIGERDAAVASGPRADAWSAAEQAESARADDDTRASLADANRAYEERFGHIYLVAAAQIRSRLNEVALPACREHVRLRTPELGTDAALIGDAELAFERLLEDPLC